MVPNGRRCEWCGSQCRTAQLWKIAASDDMLIPCMCGGRILILGGRLYALVAVLSTEYTVLSTPFCAAAADQLAPRLKLAWADDYLTISGPALPGGKVRVHYLEAYCRDGSTDRAWEETVIGHRTRLVDAAADDQSIKLQSKLNDGVV